MREDFVANGVNFLRHPKVMGTPLSQRVTFLERKGLTQEEIAEALARVEKKTTSGGEGSSHEEVESRPPAQGAAYPYPSHGNGGGGPMGPQYYPPASEPPTPPPLWQSPSFLIPASLAAGVGIGSLSLHAYRNYLADSPEGGTAEMEGHVVQQVEATPPPPEPILELARAIESQATALTALAQASERNRLDLQALFTSKVASQTSEIRSELSTIKQMLLLSYRPGSTGREGIGPLLALTSDAGAVDQKEAGIGGGAAVAAWTPEEQAAKAAEDEEKAKQEAEESKRQLQEERMAEMREATRVLYSENDKAVLTKGLDMMLIYLHNLSKYYRGDPRFRKIVKGNTNYKDRVALLKNHETFLVALGFEQSPSHFEWRKAEEGPEVADEYIKVVRAAIDLLGHLKEGGELPPPPEASKPLPSSPPPPVRTTFAAPSTPSPSRLEEKKANQLTPRVAPQSSSPLPLARQGSLQSGDRLVGGREGGGGEDGTPARQPEEARGAGGPGGSNSSGGTPVKMAGHNRQPVQGDSPPQYPESFLQVMQMMQRDETPPGILQVESCLSVDADRVPPPTQEKRPKPWELRNGE